MSRIRQWLGSISPRTRIFGAVAAVVVVLDQLSKYLAVAHLTRAFDVYSGESLGFGERLWRFFWTEHPRPSQSVAVLESFWHFNYAENPGAAWSFLANAPGWFRAPFFLIVSIAAMVFIVFYFRRTDPGQGMLRVALALVFGGAIGNFLDRARLGYVIDFIDWHWFDKATWPTFNVADAGISVGVGIMILDMLLHREKKASPEKA